MMAIVLLLHVVFAGAPPKIQPLMIAKQLMVQERVILQVIFQGLLILQLTMHVLMQQMLKERLMAIK